jgi:hypothetical protein
MNRLAVVLAADSASTVTYWSDKGKEERYFKGANKIFQLSSHRPVGLMIFDAADILKVPWEVVVKEFRQTLQIKSFNALDDYAKEFFAFLEGHARLFPAPVQKEAFLEAARSAAIGTLLRMEQELERPPEQRQQEADAAIAKRRAEVDTMPTAAGIEPEALATTIASWHDDLVAMIESWRPTNGLAFPTDMDAFADLGIVEVFKNPRAFMGATGLVFAGFGDHDVFPAMVAYRSYGMIAGKHVSHEETRMAIDYQTPAWLSAFAQTSMSDTFSLGLSEDVYSSVMQAVAEGWQFSQGRFVARAGGALRRFQIWAR